MKYILKPLKLNDIEDLGRLSLAILQEPKLRVCTGRPKNGKTALGYKLLHEILHQPSIYCKPLFIYEFVGLYSRLLMIGLFIKTSNN